MPNPMTDRDQSAYADSIRRLAIAMREMLGMRPAADNENDALPEEGKSPGRLESHNG
jgi:hypothetical protein